MKKVFTLITFFVLLLNYSNGQVRITEVNPMSNDNQQFFELYYNSSDNLSLQDYSLVIFTKDVNNNVTRVLVGDFDNISPFTASTNNSNPGNYSGTITRGAVIFSNTALQYKDGNGNSAPWVDLPYQHLFSNAFSKVVEYTLNGTSFNLPATVIADKNIFTGIQTNHKIVVFLYKKATSLTRLVDFISDLKETQSLLVGLPKIDYVATNSVPFSFDLSLVKITLGKYVGQALGVDNPYQLKKLTTKGTSVGCDLVWDKISVETPLEVLNFDANLPSWDLVPYTYSTSSRIVSSADLSEIINSVPTQSFSWSEDKNTFSLIVQFENLTQFTSYSDLRLTVYEDINGNGVFGTYTKQGSKDVFVFEDQPVNATWTSALVSPDANNYLRIDIPKSDFINGDQMNNLIVYVSHVGGCFTSEKLIQFLGAPLPATLKSISLKSSGKSNDLTWSTSSEQNNKGFEVQRSIGNTNDFKTIGFVGTRAKDGNSQTEISYSFEDTDVKPGQTHFYRLNQIDFDGKSAFSPVKSIKPGSIESNLNVYPNPSQGSFTVTTGSASGKLNIFVMDNTGRVVNQYMNVSTTNTKISNLKKGFYTLKIVNTESGEQSAQRVVVQ